MTMHHRMPNWEWLRVYYFEPSKDRLISEAVWPAMRASIEAKECAGGYFERDWVGGPNVLIGIKDPYSGVMDSIRGNIGSYLSSNPSRTTISETQYQKDVLTLSIAEDRAIHRDIKLHANNLVEVSDEPYSPLLEYEPLKEVARTFLDATSKLVAGWLELVHGGSCRRDDIILQLLIALVWTAEPTHLRAQISLCSHAHGFLRYADPAGKLEEAFAERYSRKDGGAICALLRRTVRELETQRGLIAGLDDYVALLRRTMAQIYEGLIDGRYEPPRFRRSEAIDPALPDRYMYIRLMRLLASNSVLRSWQITVNLVYLMLNQLGVSAMQRFLACYLTYRAVEDVYGESALGISRDLSETGDVSQVIRSFSA